MTATEINFLSYLLVLQQQHLLGQEQQSSEGKLFHQGAWVGPTTNWSHTGNNMKIRCRRTQPLQMLVIQITHKQEKGTHGLSLPAI